MKKNNSTEKIVWVGFILIGVVLGMIYANYWNAVNQEKEELQEQINQSLITGYNAGYQDGQIDLGQLIINQVSQCNPYVIRVNEGTFTLVEENCP
jgi:regulatory protein YycI of two-component signal transduction system YycFG